MPLRPAVTIGRDSVKNGTRDGSSLAAHLRTGPTSVAFLTALTYRARKNLLSNRMSQDSQTIADWLTPKNDDCRTRDQWRRGHHRLQIAVDTIAYSHNVPVRILLVDRLRNLPDVVARLLEDENVVGQLLKSDSSLDPHRLQQFSTVAFLNQLHEDLQAAASVSPQAGTLAGKWLPKAFLPLAVYIERKVWLTEMGNPLPVHSLCRMHDLWALHVLLWSWSHADQLGRPNERITRVLGIEGLVVRTLEPFEIRELAGPPQHAVPIVGPYFEMESQHVADAGSHRAEFVSVFERLIESASRSRFVDDPRQDGTPTHDELVEASLAKVPLTPDEALLRARTVARSLDYLRGCFVDDEALLSNLSRTAWEVVAALCSWTARWENALSRYVRPRQVISLRHEGCPIELRLTRRTNSRSHQPSLNVSIHAMADERSTPIHMAIETFLDQLESPTFSSQRRREFRLPSSYRIDRPARYVARVRERQATAWSSQLTAINNLLLRHSSRVVEAGPDPFDPYQGPDSEATPIEAKHLLRGYGARVCKHLVSLARADSASVFWLDHSYSPARLVRIGAHFRHPAHSADSLGSWARFDAHVWSAATTSIQLHAVRSRAMSISQNYRVAYSGKDESSDGSSYFECYPHPAPRESMAVPLFVSGRVIGVLSINGIVERQFDASLFWPLRRCAVLMASCISHANEVWHLRRLNYVFAENGITTLHLPVSQRGRNPLLDVARCLANIFLCSAANVWIQSASSARRLELAGTSRPDLFPSNTKLADSIFEFYYTDPLDAQPEISRTFSSLALDLWKGTRATNGPPIGQFVMAVFDPSVERTHGYDAKTASTRGAVLGRDYIEGAGAPELASRFIRERIFSADPSKGHGLADMMGFALIKPTTDGWEPVGLVTLHDEGQLRPAGTSRSRPWDYGWAPVVAHMQTHLPYLFRQAELLYGPESSGRTYVMHALRGELIPLTDRALKLHNRASAIVGRGGSAHEKLKRMQTLEPQSLLHRDLIEELASELREVWSGIEGVVLGATSQRIRFLANVANNYKTLAALVHDITSGSNFSSVLLYDLLEQLLRDVRAGRAADAPPIDMQVNRDLRISLPLEWLRMVLRELLRNIEKYSERAPVQIMWSVQHRSLRFVNECVYDPIADTRERLLEYRYQGAAARHARDRARPQSGNVVTLPGEGMGLWGIREICDALGIGFDIHIQPKAASSAQRENLGDSMALGQFVATLVFPAGIVNADTAVPAPPTDNEFF